MFQCKLFDPKTCDFLYYIELILMVTFESSWDHWIQQSLQRAQYNAKLTVGVTEPTLGPLAHTQKGQSTERVVVKESAAFTFQTPSKVNGQLTLRRPKLPDGCEGRGFKGKERRGCWGHDQRLQNPQMHWHQGNVSSICNLLGFQPV